LKTDPIERMNWTLSAGAVAVSLAFETPHFAASVAVGAVLEALNFGAMFRSARALFAGEIAGGGAWVGLFAMRFALLAPAVVLVLWAGAHPVGLVVGLSVVIPAALIASWRTRPPVLDPATLGAPDPDDPEWNASWDRFSVWRAGEVEPKENRFGEKGAPSLLRPFGLPARPGDADARADSRANDDEPAEDAR